MDKEKGYKVSRFFRRLPKHASFACKRADVDECLVGLGFETPFHELLLGETTFPECARGGPIPATFEIATASETYHGRFSTRELTIQIIPRILFSRRS